MDHWIEDVRAERGEDVVVMLVGNKSDLAPQERVVSVEEGEEKAKRLHALHIEASALTGAGVKELFTRLATSLPGNPEKGNSRSSDTSSRATSQRTYYPHPFFVVVIDVRLDQQSSSKSGILSQAASKCSC